MKCDNLLIVFDISKQYKDNICNVLPHQLHCFFGKYMLNLNLKSNTFEKSAKKLNKKTGKVVECLKNTCVKRSRR